MLDNPEAAALRETLQFLVASDMPAQHKRILMELVTQALRSGEAEVRRIDAVQKRGEQWQPHETQVVESFLQGKVARSWQHADEVLMRLAGELHREPGEVRRKATELGFGIGVDYRLAKARAMPADV